VFVFPVGIFDSLWSVFFVVENVEKSTVKRNLSLLCFGAIGRNLSVVKFLNR
jgi:hypothetical protein